MFKENREQEVDMEAGNEKEILWNEKLQEVNEIGDRLGRGIEDGVREVVAGLQFLGVETCQSCEGHDEKEDGSGSPWVSMVALDKPKYRFNGQQEITRRVADEQNVLIDELEKDPKYGDLINEVDTEAMDNGPTEEYEKWRAKNKLTQEKIQGLLKEFNDISNLSEEDQLQIFYTGANSFAVTVGEQDFRSIKSDREEMNEKEKQTSSERLAGHQNTMKLFGEFLKEKFFN